MVLLLPNYTDIITDGGSRSGVSFTVKASRLLASDGVTCAAALGTAAVHARMLSLIACAAKLHQFNRFLASRSPLVEQDYLAFGEKRAGLRPVRAEIQVRGGAGRNRAAGRTIGGRRPVRRDLPAAGFAGQGRSTLGSRSPSGRLRAHGSA